METTAATKPYKLSSEQGVTDLWWPYGPATGRYTMKATGAQSGGRMIQMVIREGRGACTPLHVHTDTDETFFVIDGEITVWVGDEVIEAAAGDYVFAPLGVPHAFAVESETAEFLVTFASAGTEGPAGHGIDGFFNEVAIPVDESDERPDPRMPDNNLFAERMSIYGIELLGPPPSMA